MSDSGTRFNSLNPYESLVVLAGDSAEELRSLLLSIKTPIKIIGSPYASGSKHYVWIMGDIRMKKTELKQVTK